jgi:23S rRNA (uracil1939-C5)-methyltransferase
VLDIDNCYLQPEPSNQIRNEVRDYAAKHNLTFFDIRDKGGFLRTLMIRITGTGEVMVVIAVYDWLEKELFALLEHLKQKFPQITSCNTFIIRKEMIAWMVWILNCIRDVHLF